MTAERTHNGGGTHRGSIEDIQRDIERHRNEVGRTLDSLERQFTPGQLLDQAMSYFRGRGGESYARNLGDAVKHNPIPVAMVGLGLGWLMASGTSRAGYLPEEDEEFGTTSRRDGFRDAMDSASEKGRSLKEGALGKGRALKEGARDAGQSMQDTAHEVRARARVQARRGANQASRAYDYVVREQPFALGALGLALGVLAGLGIPETETENELMGEKRDEFFEQARERASEAAERGKEVAQTAAEAARDEAKKELDRDKAHGEGGAQPTI